MPPLIIMQTRIGELDDEIKQLQTKLVNVRETYKNSVNQRQFDRAPRVFEEMLKRNKKESLAIQKALNNLVKENHDLKGEIDVEKSLTQQDDENWNDLVGKNKEL